MARTVHYIHYMCPGSMSCGPNLDGVVHGKDSYTEKRVQAMLVRLAFPSHKSQS